MIATSVPDIDLVELVDLEPSRVLCDIGNHSNLGADPCPREAEWRVAYSCCGRAGLYCTGHKNKFLRLVSSMMGDEITRCPHCGDHHFLCDVLVVTPL